MGEVGNLKGLKVFRGFKGVRISITGRVQGVGFRPFIYRLATGLKLTGYVLNTSKGVIIELYGQPESLEAFMDGLRKPPRLARIYKVDVEFFEPVELPARFEIVESREDDDKLPTLPPDVSTCEQCLEELYDPVDRRYRYPFINCTLCGPRYTIVLDLPYDRPRTTMKNFQMCELCSGEYTDPNDRRFHAQPIACPRCGPHLTLMSPTGEIIIDGDDETIIKRVCKELLNGKIIALKGLGGYQLLVDATSKNAVLELRRRKNRPQKPFAVMMPDIQYAERYCLFNDSGRLALKSPTCPIVIVPLRAEGSLPGVAPGSPNLGIMIPYTPLHHLILSELKKPVVCTSGNLSDEPICINEEEAVERLGKVADLILAHNRPIARHVDDSVTVQLEDGIMVLRRARGYVPDPIYTEERLKCNVLALGAHLKNTVAIGFKDRILLSQHIGNLDNLYTFEVFKRTVSDLIRLFSFKPEMIAVDMHPDYVATRYGVKMAEDMGVPLFRVQHHHAHMLSCIADNSLNPLGTWLALTWDGTGLGTDGTIWGGEVLYGDARNFKRVGTIYGFDLVGGDTAVRQPWRVALSLVRETSLSLSEIAQYLVKLYNLGEDRVYNVMKVIGKGLGIRCSSMGRLFDGISALLGLRHQISYEGQAAIELEWLAWHALKRGVEPYPLKFKLDVRNGLIILDWRPLLSEIWEAISVKNVNDSDITELREAIALGFHLALIRAVSELVEALSSELRFDGILLSGGTFQNKLLVERLAGRSSKLKMKGFKVYRHIEVPPNDGGIALGQVIAAGMS